ncbi:hypothetical protein Pmani_001168 [Petrolisthes manimaculis]|uniref:Radical S-adenosyl methionine domain-containing protein 1, mitochondrial n=1 Tax=Petrolisthes manimaculis TaxID=1843537 RepID=A0AAE1QL16_9EUCA|nr:hypothetical protein Pmani_001168 [Petrolisthes manimaculis]
MDQVLEDAMVREIQYSLQGSYITKVFSVYFGGGTPSLARPHLIQKVLQGIQDVCELDEKAEVTLEVNPTPTQTNKLQHFKAAGINRVSIGVQSLDNDVLRHLNRDHSVSDAVACINVAQQLFTGRVSLDAIFGLPNQTLERWRQDVRTIVNLCKDHLSLYQLTVEPGTQLYHQVKSGEVKVPCVDQLADMYEASVQMLKDVGLGRYEVSNFASNYSTQSRHNKAYWQASQYLGVGPGAHTRIVHNDNIDMGCTESGNLRKKNTPNLNISLTDIIREARVNACDPVSWLREVGRKGTGVRKVEQQTRLDVASEYLASGLRSTDGVTEARWSVFLPQHTLYDIFSDRAKWLQQEQLIILSPEGMKVSELGLNVLDSILPHLLSILVEKTSN